MPSAPAGSRAGSRTVLDVALLADGRRRLVAVSALGLIGHEVGEMLVPVTIGQVIDRAVIPGDGRALAQWLGVLVLVFLGLTASWRIGYTASCRIYEQGGHALRMRVVDRLLDPRGSATPRLGGDLLTVTTADVSRVGWLAHLITSDVAVAAGLVTAAVSLLLIQVPLGLVVLLGTPPVLVLMHFASGPLERRALAEQEKASQAGALASDLVAGLRVLHGIGATGAAGERYRLASRRSLRAGLRAAAGNAGYEGLSVVVSGVFLVTVVLLAAREALAGTIGVGDLIAVVGLAQMLQEPLGRLAFFGPELATIRASARRIGAVLDDAPAVAGGDLAVREGSDELRLDDVRQGPLAGVTVGAGSGELLGVACTDPAAAGVLAQLLGRRLDPDGGTVTLAGTALTELAPEAVRAAVLSLPHEPVLFAGSLRDDVFHDHDESRVRSSSAASTPAATAILDEMLEALLADVLTDGGWEREVRHRGRTLSGGQRQRISLARALAAQPPVLVLHEPLTSVDSVTEAVTAHGLREVRKGATTVLITTSPTLLAVCDWVVLVDDGRVAGSGPHGELLEKHSGYAELVAR